MHRLRHAARSRSFNRPLKGTVKVDGTFVGGKEKNNLNKRNKTGRGPIGNEVVFGALARNGDLRTVHLHSLKQVKAAVEAHVAEGSIVVSDEYAGYKGLSKKCGHKTVNHSSGEYANTGNYLYTNSIEGAWSHIKRQFFGIHHWISDKHLGNYLSEMTWRYNHRNIEDGNRMNEFFGRAEGRLRYMELIA